MKWIDKEQLGMAVQKTKEDMLKNISPLKNTIDTISIAQKTVNTKGINELLNQEVTFVMESATTNGAAKDTLIDTTIDLTKSIENYDFIQIYAKINSVTRKLNYDTTTLSLPIAYNNSDIANLQDGSAIYIIFSQATTLSGAFGAFHFVILGWFKTPTQFYIRSVTNPITNAEYNTFSISSIKGIKIENVTIDPVEYVNTNSGIEDIPVGHILSQIGIMAPKHYIICDGAEYNITDYPYLSQYIKDQFGSFNFFGGDGITTFAVPNTTTVDNLYDLTPEMTSSNTPAPYVVTQSAHTTNAHGWKAFDKQNIYIHNGAIHYWNFSGKVGWLKIDFGKKINPTHFAMGTRTKYSTDGDYVTDAPKDFSIYGSNDDTTYELISTQHKEQWLFDETVIFPFDKMGAYRYFRLNIESNNGYEAHTTVTEIKYLTLKNIDCIKYEPTYFMNIQGLIEETALWEGSLLCQIKETYTHINTDINLSDNISNYDKIRFVYCWNNGTKDAYFCNEEFDINKMTFIGNTDFDIFTLNVFFDFIMSLKILYISDNILRIGSSIGVNMIMTSGTHIKITKIIGIKYKTFQNNNINGGDN